MKKCSKCNIEKENDGFHRRTGVSDGLQSTCKPCRSLIDRIKNSKPENKLKQKHNFERRMAIPGNRLSLREARNKSNGTPEAKEAQAQYDKVRSANPEKRAAKIATSKRWSKTERGRETINKNNKMRYENDPVYRLKILLRGRIKSAFCGAKIAKGKKSEEALGCTYKEAYRHLESTLPIGYTMEDVGKKLHIDHREPIGLAETVEDLYRLSHYTNLCLLTIEDHMEKTKRDISRIKALKKSLKKAA